MNKLICGVDEAGRGPLAGPVTAAAVILNPDFPVKRLKDSKKLTAIQREKIFRLICSQALDWSLGWVWPAEIDRINIHNASLKAMRQAIARLKLTPESVLIDGKFVPRLSAPCRAIIKGDTFIPPIQAASILAKVARDAWMIRYAAIEPDYLFDKHKGYPTKEHKLIISRLGLSPIHRRSFHYQI